MKLPPIEKVAALVHAAWMRSKRAQGIRLHYSYDGENLMVPYRKLSENVKEIDRATVRAVYAAIYTANKATR